MHWLYFIQYLSYEIFAIGLIRTPVWNVFALILLLLGLYLCICVFSFNSSVSNSSA